MGTVSSSFKATVTFGGLVSSSFKSSSAILTKSIKETEVEVAKLTKKQEQLKKKIKEGTLAGKNVDKLKREYTDLDRSIKKTNEDATKLNKTLMTRKAWSVPLAGLSRHAGLTGLAKGVVGGVTGKLKGIHEKGLIPSALSGAGAAAGGLGALVAGGIGGALTVNAETAEQVGVARTYGVNLTTFKAWDAMGKLMGLSGENIGDLGEELANKVGEFKALGKQSSVSDAFQGLGLTSADLAGKTNEEQMAMVLDTAMKANDEQVGRSMVDMLMGGEGNKILTWMKLSGKTYEQLIAEQKKYILTTDEGTDGAVRGQMALSNLWSSLGSAAEEVIGTLAGDLAPSITKYADDFASWFRTGGREVMVNGITDFASSLQDFWKSKLSPVLSALWQGLQVLAEKIQEWFPSIDVELKKTRTSEEAYQIGWRESEKNQKKEAESQGVDFVFDTDRARQDALAMMQQWQSIKDEQSAARTLQANGAYSGYDISGEAMSRDDYLLSLTDPVKSTPGDESGTPLSQTFSMPITIMTQPGADASAIGDALSSTMVDFTKNIGGISSGIYTPASYNGG
ncbi:hypothetical protein HAX39_25015 [Citrobacter freundii]|nr:hypothetical protein [Citrobacter freundii]